MARLYNNGRARPQESGPSRTQSIAFVRKLPRSVVYLPLSVPIILFICSLYIPPIIFIDSGIGFLALRSMLEGGAFNSITVADPANIANDVAIFLTFASPGQYLVPGLFIRLGTSYGLALSLTALIATLIGVLGWIQVARSFAASFFVLFVFVLGLCTFSYVTLPFRVYHGGELLLFAAAPWSLYGMRWAANKPPTLCFAISLVLATLLFFAKLTGLIVFATNLIAISLQLLVSQRRLNPSIIGMWVAACIAAVCFTMFWVARGPLPADGSTLSFSWLPVWFSITAAALSGISGLEFLDRLLAHYPWARVTSDISLLTYVLGPFALLLMVWVWLRLRYTPYRDTAVLLLTIILLYVIAVAAMYLRGAAISIQERHFRYAGILFFLLLLTATDQSDVRFAKALACVGVIILGLFGLKNSVTGPYGYAQMRAGYYDPMTGISQDMVSPAILEYLRSEITRHNYKRPVILVPSPAAIISLPSFRIIYPFGKWSGYIDGTKWFGRAEKVFVVLPEKLVLNGKTGFIVAAGILRSLANYEFDKWKHTKLDRMDIYTQ